MESHVTNPRPNHAMASSAWLLSLVKFGGSSPGVLARLKDLHSAFARLLNDRDGALPPAIFIFAKLFL